MKTNEIIIRDAINRSISHNERVHVTIGGCYGELYDAIIATWTDEWEECDENCDDMGRPVVDVWGYSDGTGDTMDWRLCVTLDDRFGDNNEY